MNDLEKLERLIGYAETVRLRTGHQVRYRFDNGFGASVVRHSGSYGSKYGLWEVALIHYEKDGDWELVYNKGKFADVVGDVHVDDVSGLLDTIAAMPSDYETYPSVQSASLSGFARALDSMIIMVNEAQEWEDE